MKKYIEFNLDIILYIKGHLNNIFNYLNSLLQKKIFVCKYVLLNLLSISLIILTVVNTIIVKNYNFQISQEIKYMNAEIEEQKNYKKILESELSLITSPSSLFTLYDAYYKEKSYDNSPKIVQIKNIENIKSYYLVKNYSQLNKSSK